MNEWIRGSAPMTKEEIRIISLSKMRVASNSKILDIGGGTGATAIEFALSSKSVTVTVIEKQKEAVELIKKNIEKFKVENINVIHGEAPKDLPDEIFDSVFIGGSGNNLDEIFQWIEGHLSHEGFVVGNTIAIESMHRLLKCFEKYMYEEIDITQVSISKGKKIAGYTMMIANNPITIISGKRRG
jgi:precorrin-6Y C5,15-methyltransferase (decarboxylating) CbiT subunit